MTGVRFTDRDLGWKDIQKQMNILNSKVVKVGVTKEKGKEIPSGVRKDGKTTIVQYAYWNETGVYGKSGWKIPPRPFVKGWAVAKEEEIMETLDKIGLKVSGGLLKAQTALESLGIYGRSGIVSFIRDSSNFIPNAPSTIKSKGSSKPLIDEGFLMNAIAYEIAPKREDNIE